MTSYSLHCDLYPLRNDLFAKIWLAPAARRPIRWHTTLFHPDLFINNRSRASKIAACSIKRCPLQTKILRLPTCFYQTKLCRLPPTPSKSLTQRCPRRIKSYWPNHFRIHRWNRRPYVAGFDNVSGVHCMQVKFRARKVAIVIDPAIQYTCNVCIGYLEWTSRPIATLEGA